jgi:hypothetical protein
MTENRGQMTDDRNWNSEVGSGIRNDKAEGRGHGIEHIAFKKLLF